MIQDELRARLLDALDPLWLQIDDESAQHAGHVGAQGGASHLRVTIVATKFENLTKVARHRLVYDSCADLMHARIHALAIVALTPTEASERKTPAQG